MCATGPRSLQTLCSILTECALSVQRYNFAPRASVAACIAARLHHMALLHVAARQVYHFLLNKSVAMPHQRICLKANMHGMILLLIILIEWRRQSRMSPSTLVCPTMILGKTALVQRTALALRTPLAPNHPLALVSCCSCSHTISKSSSNASCLSSAACYVLAAWLP